MNDVLLAQNNVLELLESRFIDSNQEAIKTIFDSYALLNREELFSKLLLMENTSKDFKKLGRYDFEEVADVYLERNFCSVNEFQLEMSFERKKRQSFMTIFEKMYLTIYPEKIVIKRNVTESSDFGVESHMFSDKDSYENSIQEEEMYDFKGWLDKINSLIKDEKTKIEMNLYTTEMN